MKRTLTIILLAACAGLLGAVSAEADLIEDFETCLPGPIDGQNGWVAADPTSVVIVEPDDNQCLVVATDSTWLSREAVLLDGVHGTLFLRFMIEEQQSFSFGLSDRGLPTRFDDFEVELNMANSPNVLRVNSAGTYDVVAMLEPGVWYNAWLVVDNVSDDWQLFLHDRTGEHAHAGDQLAAAGVSTFDFRNRTAGNLYTFFVKTGGGSGPLGPLMLDDLWLASDVPIDLSNPLAPADPAPPAGAIPGSAGDDVAPLLLDRTTEGDVRLTWDFSCLVGDADYEVYEGFLGDYYTHGRLTCTTAGAREATVALPDDDRYYLVVPHNGEREGSYGRHSSGAERPPAIDACLTQHIGECL